LRFPGERELGLFERMMLGMRGRYPVPNRYVASFHVSGVRMTNFPGVNDPELTEMITLQRRSPDVAKGRAIVMAQRDDS